jgi:hypothetical protein
MQHRRTTPMIAFWRTEDGRLHIGNLALLVLLCGGTIYNFGRHGWDATDVLVLPLFIFGMTAIATARDKMRPMSSTSERLRSPLYAVGVIAVVAMCGLLASEFIWGSIEAYNKAAVAGATVER